MIIYRAVTVFCIVTFIAVLAGGACDYGTAEKSGNLPVITSLTAEHTTIYSVGNTRITCAAIDPNGYALDYKWVSNDGTITGSGPTITWEAPKTYGDFHIMATVDNGRGGSASKTVTVTVIVRDLSDPGCCR